MVRKSPGMITVSPGTPWGLLVFFPVTTMGSNEFPSPEELWERMINEKKLSDKVEDIIREPYHVDNGQKPKIPRYYQRIAINRTIEAIANGKNRILLVMATGTGKTFTAFQIAHRLWKSGTKKKILYLADRNILIDQTMAQDFMPSVPKTQARTCPRR